MVQGKRCVDKIELSRLKASGMSVTALAKHFGTGKGTISKNLTALRKEALKESFPPEVSGRELAIQEVVGSRINAQEKIEKISHIVESELDRIHRELNDVAEVPDGIPGSTKGVLQAALRRSQLEHTGELRKILETALAITQALFKMEETEAFKRIVLAELGKESEELRDRVLRRIGERRGKEGGLSG